MITILGGVTVAKNAAPSANVQEAIAEHGIWVPYNPDNSELSARPEYWNEAGQVGPTPE